MQTVEINHVSLWSHLSFLNYHHGIKCVLGNTSFKMASMIRYGFVLKVPSIQDSFEFYSLELDDDSPHFLLFHCKTSPAPSRSHAPVVPLSGFTVGHCVIIIFLNVTCQYELYLMF